MEPWDKESARFGDAKGVTSSDKKVKPQNRKAKKALPPTPLSIRYSGAPTPSSF